MLNDLRILRLALNMEESFERYEESLRDLIPQVPVRAKLAGLFAPGVGHLDLKEACRALSKAADGTRASLETTDILQTLKDCEDAAHEFYLHYLDRLSDPRLVDVFKRLAEEERQHAQLVSEAQAIAESLPRAGTSSPVEA